MTDRYAVIGNPIAHSKSPLIHAEFARQTSQAMTYEALLSPLDGFADSVKRFVAEGGLGMNVTVPFKLEAWNIATDLTERAFSAEAVNTLKFSDGEWLGDNTDGAGLIQDIVHNRQNKISGCRILLMGAGGAARGVLLPLLLQQPTQLTIVNRTMGKATELQYLFRDDGPVNAASYADLKGMQFDLVINATSSSLHNELPPLPQDIFAEDALAYDMMYGKGQTPFLQFAAHQGVTKLADGIGMLVEQAAEAFYVWRGIRPQTDDVMRNLRG